MTTNFTVDTVIAEIRDDSFILDDMLRNALNFTADEINDLIFPFMRVFLNAVAADPEHDPDNIEMDNLDFADRDRLFDHDWLTFADAIETLNTLDSIVGLRADDDHTIFLIRESAYFRLIYELRDLFIWNVRHIFGDDAFDHLVISDIR